MTSIPSGFVNKPKPKSVAEAVNQNSHDRLKTIAKAALQGYIASYLDTNGVNRSIVNAVSPAGLTFVTDKSLQDSKDPQYKPTQLARMYNEIREKLPSILILDSGFQWIPSGLNGGLEAASNLNGKWQGYYRLTARVPVTIAIVTADQETTDMLSNILMLLFDPFRNISGGSALHSSNSSDNWEVRLPLTFTVGANAMQEYENDPTGRFWSSSIEMELSVEDQVCIETDLLTASISGYVVNTSLENIVPQVFAPSQVSLKEGSFIINIDHYNPMKHRVVIDKPDIASVEIGNFITVTPHRIGKFNIKILNNTMAGKDVNPLAPATWRELSTKEITVVF